MLRTHLSPGFFLFYSLLSLFMSHALILNALGGVEANLYFVIVGVGAWVK